MVTVTCADMVNCFRIIHVLDSLDLAMGGPPVAVAGLAAAQAGLGHEVIIVSNESPAGARVITATDNEFPGLEKVKIYLAPHAGLLDKLTCHAGRKLLRELIRKDDIIHLQGIWRPILKVAAQEARRAGARYVCAPLGMLHPWALRQKRWKKQLALVAEWRAILSNAAFLHVLNSSEANYIDALGLGVETRVIPNGIFPEQVDSALDSSPFMNRHPELMSRAYILFLGRLHYVKGLDYVAAAFGIFSEKVKDVDLVVAGPDGGARDSFLKDVERLGIQERVHVVGPLYGAEKYAAMRGASCLFQPSRQEGFSMAVTEAMACGLPVVLSEECNFPEVANSDAGVVINLDAQAFSNALTYILKDENRRKAMGAAARELVLRDYTWPAVARLSIAAYSDASSA